MGIRRALPPYQPRINEVLRCLGLEQDAARLLMRRDNTYNGFLEFLITKAFFRESRKLAVKEIANDFGIPAAKATSWISLIYGDLLSLNSNNPEMFCEGNVSHTLIFYAFGRAATWNTVLPSVPRYFERFSFPFIHAAIGFDSFWVKDINNVYKNGKLNIDIFLDGHDRNMYRELLAQEAVFSGALNCFEPFDLHQFELDEKLKKWEELKKWRVPAKNVFAKSQ